LVGGAIAINAGIDGEKRDFVERLENALLESGSQ
jgi:hypothetical protein